MRGRATHLSLLRDPVSQGLGRLPDESRRGRLSRTRGSTISGRGRPVERENRRILQAVSPQPRCGLRPFRSALGAQRSFDPGRQVPGDHRRLLIDTKAATITVAALLVGKPASLRREQQQIAAARRTPALNGGDNDDQLFVAASLVGTLCVVGAAVSQCRLSSGWERS